MHKLALSLTPDSAWDESGVRDKPGKKAHKALWIDICATFTSIILGYWSAEAACHIAAPDRGRYPHRPP